jgi:hypothetical protein
MSISHFPNPTAQPLIPLVNSGQTPYKPLAMVDFTPHGLFAHVRPPFPSTPPAPAPTPLPSLLFKKKNLRKRKENGGNLEKNPHEQENSA